MTTSHIQQLIAEARLPEALVALKENLPPHLQNDIVQLQSRLSELLHKERSGSCNMRRPMDWLLKIGIVW